MKKYTYHPIYFMVLISVSVLACFTSLSSEEDSWRFVEEYGSGLLMYPRGFLTAHKSFVLHPGGFIIVHDAKGEHPIYAINTTTKEYSGIGSWGRGPGEILNDSPVNLSIADNIVYAHDILQRKVIAYNIEGEYLGSISTAELGIIGTAHIISGDLMLFRKDFYSPAEEAVAYAGLYGFSIIDGTLEKSASLLKYSEIDDFRQVKRNASLKEGQIISKNDRIYLLNIYSSLLLSLETNGTVIFKNYEPFNERIPDTPVREIGGVLVGDPERVKLQNLSLSADSEYIYILYSGLEYKYIDLAKAAQLIDFSAERAFEGKTLLIFRKDYGEFIGRFDTPVWAVDIEVDEDYIYFLTWEEQPRILKYSKPLK